MEKQKNRDKVILSTKDLVFKERLVKNLMERYVESYVVEKVILKNLKLLVSMRIHPVVIVSRIVIYREPVKGQKIKEPKPVEVDRVEEQEVEKILNRRKVRRVIKYLVYWERFIAEYYTWKKEEDLENVKELVDEFERRMEAEVR